jgi:hypothetical protein
VITYASETWVLKESVKQKLLITERRILRTTFGLAKERDGTRRTKTDELNNLIKTKNIIKYIQTGLVMYLERQKIGWSKNCMNGNRYLQK